MPFQVRVTNSDWLEHLSTIGCLDAANFWTNRTYSLIGERIIFVRQGSIPRRISGWGTLESKGEMTSPDHYWDARDCDGKTSAGSKSKVTDKTHFMILKDVVLLGDHTPLETDIFNEENGYEIFPQSGGGTKNYDDGFPPLLDDREAVEILSEGAAIGVKEGRATYVTHVKRERRACQKFREEMISDSKKLNKVKVPCEVCKIDMLGRYNVGVPIIDCHHLFPLSELDGEEVETTKDDLALLCPSCHRAIHKLDDCSNLDELRRRLRE